MFLIEVRVLLTACVCFYVLFKKKKKSLFKNSERP